jgi:hypothetical protein
MISYRTPDSNDNSILVVAQEFLDGLRCSCQSCADATKDEKYHLFLPFPECFFTRCK